MSRRNEEESGGGRTIGERVKGKKRTPKKTKKAILSQNRHGMLTSSEESGGGSSSLYSRGEIETNEEVEDATEETTRNTNDKEEATNPTTTAINTDPIDEMQSDSDINQSNTNQFTRETEEDRGNRRNHNGSGRVDTGWDGEPRWKEFILESGKKMRISVQNENAADPRWNIGWVF